MTLKIVFSVDDFAPVPGYGLYLTNGPLKYLKKLHEEFGCKFTMFSIPMMEGKQQHSWSNNDKWCDKVKKYKWLEIAQHGLTHKAQKEQWGSNEFYQLDEKDSKQRIITGKQILVNSGFDIKGFKAPGWTLPINGYSMIKNINYDYLADHFFGNKIIMYKDLARVPLTFSIDRIYHDKYDDYLILHSHMNPSGGNLNGWNEQLYGYVRNYLSQLNNKYEDIEFITMSELVEEQKK